MIKDQCITLKILKLVAWIPWIAISECFAHSFLRVMHPSTMSRFTMCSESTTLSNGGVDFATWNGKQNQFTEFFFTVNQSNVSENFKVALVWQLVNLQVCQNRCLLLKTHFPKILFSFGYWLVNKYANNFESWQIIWQLQPSNYTNKVI